MSLELGWITMDAPDPARIAPFWEELLGWERTDENDRMIELTAPEGGPRLLLYLAPDAKMVKNRMHLDLVTDDLEAEVHRAVDLGARRIDIGQGDDVRWVVLADPEGNEFCIVPRSD